MERHIRNQAITEAYEAGEPVAALAERFGLKPASIKQILRDFEFYTRIRGEQTLPKGISLVAAVTIVQAIGIWPAPSNLDEILDRRIELLRAAHGRHVKMALAEVSAANGIRETP
ncbi:hypothetical protein [Rhizobium sp. AB2/73]|uniref:hypothetical protein n=1 Tax=Rhizobium sp. AB2/73 TaxID=2795216 RepID=UPI001C5E00B1|nr:hypothetical protein [Rhizobium sp. AB2/73]QYA17574.1 hypothetical protein J5284_34705 [Rhizobium sp. AB2/73]UEQ85898.1 hypothetical protein I8E17_34645 [Rhizobium sp. AB2/73]